MKTLIELFKLYGFEVLIENGVISPSVTTYELKVQTGTRISKLQSSLQDIARDAGFASMRLVSSNSKIYLEVSNIIQTTIEFNEIIKSKSFMHSSSYELLLGINTFNKPLFANLRKLPHLLVGGSTGSGKSVGIHMILCSLLAKNSPDTLQLLLIDPKKTELGMYNTVPHLISNVITEAETTGIALESIVQEMENRYTKMEQMNTRDMLEDMPVLLIVIDEMADLILTDNSTSNIEKNLIRLAQKARACGIHIIAATQRPSREVVTGLIKANFPARLAYKTASSIDSRVILDSKGAEVLLGQGDSLYSNVGGLQRVKATYMSDEYLIKFLNGISSIYKPMHKRQVFIKNEQQDILNKEEKQSKNISRNTKINLALWSTFGYCLYKMIQSFLRLLFSPVKGKGRGAR